MSRIVISIILMAVLAGLLINVPGKVQKWLAVYPKVSAEIYKETSTTTTIQKKHKIIITEETTWRY